MSTPKHRKGDERRDELNEELGEVLRASNPNMSGPERGAGGMGVSSEWVGPTGPGQEATDGQRDTSVHERDPHAAVPPEQAPGGPETNPEGIAPKAGYPHRDPRAADKPYQAPPDV